MPGGARPRSSGSACPDRRGPRAASCARQSRSPWSVQVCATCGAQSRCRVTSTNSRTSAPGVRLRHGARFHCACIINNPASRSARPSDRKYYAGSNLRRSDRVARRVAHNATPAPTRRGGATARGIRTRTRRTNAGPRGHVVGRIRVLHAAGHVLRRTADPRTLDVGSADDADARSGERCRRSVAP
jgi:hypothetical protein